MTGADSSACKLILLGNGSAGKTSICNRFKDDGFQRVYKQTVGIDFYEKKLRIRDKELTLQVWDIGGQSISSKMIGQYIWGAAIIFLVYDVTDMQSFKDVGDWYALVTRTYEQRSSTTAEAKVPVAYLVGNKVDLEHLRKVSQESHDKFIEQQHLAGGFLISARSGHNVLTSFYKAAAVQLSIELTEQEVEQTAKVLGVALAAQDGTEARTAEADAIEKEDAEAEARKNRACCILQ